MDLVKILRKKIIFNNAIVTRGTLGSVFFSCKNWSSIYCPAFNQKGIDTIGAGDTFLTLAALCLSKKLDPKLVLLFSSLAAAYSTNQLGNKLIFNYSILKKQINHILK